MRTMKPIKSVLKNVRWTSRWMIAAAVIGSLLAGLTYYMGAVDAVGSGWMWFLGATLAFFALEIYFSHGTNSNSRVEMDPDGDDDF